MRGSEWRPAYDLRISAHRHPERKGELLVSVRGLSGVQYPVGTVVTVSGNGSAVDAFIRGDWLPLRWWEFKETDGEQAPPPNQA